MKRYFLAPPGTLPHEVGEPLLHGEYHYIDLDSHGETGQGHRVVVLMDERKAPHPAWQELPHLLDAQTTLAHAKHAQHLAKLSVLGAKPAHGGFTLAKHLATIHPQFEP